MPNLKGIVITKQYRVILFKYGSVSGLSNKNTDDILLSLITICNTLVCIPYNNITFIKYKDGVLYFPRSFIFFCRNY